MGVEADGLMVTLLLYADNLEILAVSEQNLQMYCKNGLRSLTCLST